jgi:threonyl-tRNA synthetase
MNISISLPDGSKREFPMGVRGSEIAGSISEGLARVSLAIEVDGEIWDLSRPLQQDAEVRILTWNDKGGKYAFWHSSAHSSDLRASRSTSRSRPGAASSTR